MTPSDCLHRTAAYSKKMSKKAFCMNKHVLPVSSFVYMDICDTLFE